MVVSTHLYHTQTCRLLPNDVTYFRRAQYCPTRGGIWNAEPFYSGGRPCYYPCPIDSYTLFSLPRPSPALLPFHCNRLSYQRVLTSRPLFLHRNLHLTYSRARVLQYPLYPRGNTVCAVHRSRSIASNVDDQPNVCHKLYHDTRISSPPVTATSPPILFLVLYYSAGVVSHSGWWRRNQDRRLLAPAIIRTGLDFREARVTSIKQVTTTPVPWHLHHFRIYLWLNPPHLVNIQYLLACGNAQSSLLWVSFFLPIIHEPLLTPSLAYFSSPLIYVLVC